MSTRKNTTVINSLVATGITAVAAALTVLIFTTTPIFSLSEGPENFEAQNEGTKIYYTAWSNIQTDFVFTDRLKDWSTWQHKYDGKIKSKADGIKFAKEMVDSLKDPYTRVLDEAETKDETDQMQGKLEGVGLSFVALHDDKGNVVKIKDKKDAAPLTDANKHVLVRKVLKQTPAHKAGLKAGDAVLSINGKSADGMGMNELVKTIRGPAGTTINLGILRDRKTFNVLLTRQKFDIESVSYHQLPDNLGYIRIDTFMSENTGDECLRALKALKGCRGYVLDLRSNPGGLVNCAQDVMALFAEKGVVFSVNQRSNGQTLEGKVLINDSMPHMAAKKPLVVLVDNDSASAAEIVAGSLRDNRHVKLIGTRTFGKGLMQSVSRIGTNTQLHLTMAKWSTPNGECPGSNTAEEHPSGLQPTVKSEIGPNFEMDTDKDNQLQTGIKVLKEELK